MARNRANDWGALSETLAAHRAQKLCAYLPNALAFGFYETEPTNEPLKNFDTDSLIEHPDSSFRFFISLSDMPVEERKTMLVTLQKTWDQFDKRHQMPDIEWTAQLAKYLMDLAEMRIEHVFLWIQSNLSRFKSNHANMDLLRRDFEGGAVDLKSNIEICRMQCATCNLLCLLDRRHDPLTPHDCQTSHDCPHPCDFDEEHTKAEKCGYPAGHSGKHICVVGVHLCGQPCTLEDKNGCLKKCIMVAKHSDERHMCASPIHACGETYSCPQTCTMPSHDVDHQHVCNTISCPLPCELCKRLCANTNHLHGLEVDARHLCGQQHNCNSSCSADGICQIDIVPQSIEATFVGRHDTFPYTKLASKRLHCAIVIPPGELEHTGHHIHSTEPAPFHFCETRCANCGYFCTLPLGHSQQEHETSHGSMSKTTWAIDGPNDAVLELKGRKFASSDDGAPMMCNLICQDIGRHVHIDYCRAVEDAPCDGPEIEHIHPALTPNPERSKDWISHSLFWKRTDPYSQDDQANFAKCDAMCPGPEHAEANPPSPSYCSLPIFHPTARAGQGAVQVAGAQGYTSNDGHIYTCKNPAEMRPAYHVIFVIDKSSSMAGDDLHPLPNRPGAALITRHADNRLGAVFSALHAFWMSRSSALDPGIVGARKDAYSVVFFDGVTSTCLQNDRESTPDDLLTAVLQYTPGGWTNSRAALSAAETLMRDHWNNDLAPVVIFLSDGECNAAQDMIESLARTALDLGHPLSFHSVLFGDNDGRESLQSMAQSALEIQNGAPNNVAQRLTVSSSFSEALDEVRLAETFLGFAESLRKPRGSLLR
ncbi:hypothetical protein B0H10DRAFT_2165565 [Mycena sp. CBHHK59/15]|nr:hypothetical protein B0H10DRAFT_2165565 [Mycena sp. CBHHK59/15]